MPEQGIERSRVVEGAVCAGIALVALFAYGGALDNFFLERDDPTLLWGARIGRYPIAHFRPVHRAWNQALLGVFGTVPLGWYAAGIGLHVLNAWLAALLVKSATGCLRAGAVAGLTFAAFYSPHEAVLWIAASCGLLAMAAMLGSALAWVRYLRTSGRGAYVLALALAALAMGCKEECVLLLPLLVGLDVALHGWRPLLQKRALARYLPCAVLAGAYLAVALRPSHWGALPSLGQYSLRLALVPKLCASFAALFAPRDVEPLPEHAALFGALLMVLLAAIAWRARSMGRWVGLGIALAVAGFLPVLPGPADLQLAGTRYAYPSAIGVAFLAAGLFESAWRVLDRPRVRRGAHGALALVFAAWIGAQVMAVRSVEGWRYERSGARLERLVLTTRAAVLDPVEVGDAAVVAPGIWNVVDYSRALFLFTEVQPAQVRVEHALLGASLDRRLSPGGDLAPGPHAVFVSPSDAAIVRLRSTEEIPRAQWEEVARAQERRGLGFSVPIVWIEKRGDGEAAGDLPEGR